VSRDYSEHVCCYARSFLVAVQWMARASQQLEFKWTSWLRKLKSVAKPKPKSKPRPSGIRTDKELTDWCVDASAGLELPGLAKNVRVSWNSRMQTTAGRAIWPDRVIELNLKLRDCGEDEVWRTLKHELAHLVAYERYGRRRISPHGAEWKAACDDLGIPGEGAYHSLPFKKRKVARKHIYVCPSCSTAIRRVKPFRRAVACYDCCRKFGDGEYIDRFRLVKQKPTA